MYLLGAAAPWVALGDVVGFRFIPFRATYAPDVPYSSPDSRFGAPNRLTLYVAQNSPGAAAEFYRRHPEFLSPQGGIARIRIFRLALRVGGKCLDVRTQSGAAAVG